MRERKQEKSKWNPASWGKTPKRILAMGLAVALVGGMVDLSPLAADARTQTTEKQSVITAFQELPQDIREQQLPLEAKESDINFPDTLTVTLQQTVIISGRQETESEEETSEESITEEDSENQNRETQETTETKESGENAAEESQGKSDNSSGEKKGQKESLENPEAEGNTHEDTPQTENLEQQQDNSDSRKEENLEDSQEQSKEENEAEQQEEARSAGFFQTLSWKSFFPRKLVVQAAESDAASGNTDNTRDNANSTETTKTVEKECTLENIRWKLDQAESDAAEFDASETSNGFCYVYTPILPDTDKDGNPLTVKDGAELPAIYVLVGKPQIALLAEGDVAEVTVDNGASTTYQTVSDALEAIQTAINDATGNVDITLKFLADTTVTGLRRELDGNGKTNLTIDMNGKTVGIDWEPDGRDDDFELTMTNLKAILTGTGTLSATVNIGENAHLTANGEFAYQGMLTIKEGAAAALANWNDNVGVKGDIEIETDGSCMITGGTYHKIVVKSEAKLKVSGDTTKITSLYAWPNSASTVNRAEIELSGGTYDGIAFYRFIDSSYLEDSNYQCAIIDMLASGYTFYNSSDNETEVTPARTDTKLQNVKVLSEPEVIVSFQITKTDGTKETKNFATWNKAMSYLSDSGSETEFATWKKVEILLQKDASISDAAQMVSSDKLSAELVLRSGGNTVYTLSGMSNVGMNIALYTNGQKLTVENIKTDGASIKVVDGTVTIRKGAVLAASGSSAGGTIDVTGSTLILEDGASVSSTYATESDQIAILMADAGTLRIKKGAQVSGRVYFDSKNVESSVVIEEGAALPAISSVSSAKASVYCNLDSTEPGDWDAITGAKVYFLIECNGVTLESYDNNITKYDGKIYGRFYEPDVEYGYSTKIEVPDTVCSYQLTNGTITAVDADHTFQMPSAKVTLLKHSPDASGTCPYCGKTDLAVAYKNGKLQINGLTGRTYDSQPQILTTIRLEDADGNSKKLTGPQYNSGYTLAQDSTNPVNASIGSINEYDLIYENNINAYDKKPGDSGFDASKAPKVTIIGHGDYTGTIEYYFTIGQGTLQMFNFGVRETEYNGYSQGALHYGIVGYALDETDKDPRAKLYLGGPDRDHECAKVSTDKTIANAGYDSVAAMKIEYSTDNGSTWTEIAENNQDTSKANYLVRDAGTYDFQVRVTDGDNATPAVQSLTATIQPQAITDSKQIVLDSSPITAYYTGKPIIPAGDLIKITAPYIPDSNGKTPYVLEKDKDFTVSAENNTEVKDKATLTITGTGNYTGTLTKDFSIAYAFELAQTTASQNHWYNKNVPAVFGVADTTGNTADAVNRIVYRNAVAASDTELNGDVKLYSTLDDAISGTGDGYTFTEEGKQTVTLYGKDSAKGYIAKPVSVTVQIDKTAPTWADIDGDTENYGIQVKDNWWRTFLNKISFGTLYNDATLDMKLHASDKKDGVKEVSGIDKYYYYVDTVTDETDDTATKTKAQLDAMAAQGKFQSVSPDSGLFSGEGATVSDVLSNSGRYVIYAYAVDKAGNQSDYICTEGLVVDNQAPVLTVTAPTQEKGTLMDNEAALLIQSDEAAELVYFYQSEDDDDKQIQYVDAVNAYIDMNVTNDSRLPFATKKNGKWVSEVEVGGEMRAQVTGDSTGVLPLYCVELKAGQNSITLTGLNTAKRADVWMAAIDKAGNITDTKTLNLTTTKTMPRITTLPQLSGVYGDTPAELTVTPGVAKIYGESEVDGTWEVVSDSTEKLEVGTTRQCTVKFIPKNTDYAEAYVKVTPTITKRPITIKVADMTKVYQDSMPEIAFDIPGSNIGKVQLADGDTKETIKSSLQLVTEATADSEVGTYSFTVTSDSQNYEVTTFYVENLNDLVNEIKRHGTMTITPAAGELTQGTGYTDTKTVTYGDAPFALNVTANHTESKIAYVVTEEKDADGSDISEGDGHILSVSADGMVTINGAGSADIQISLPASKNYTAPADLTVKVTVNRQAVTIPEQSRSYLYDRGGTDTIDLAALLPKDCGKASYTVSSKTDAVFETASVTSEGKLSYKVKTGTIGTTGEIRVDIKTANYTVNGNTGSGGQFTIKATLADRKPVEPKTTVNVKNPTLTYGEPVSKLQFNPVTFVEQGTDQRVAGTLAWDTPDAKLSAGAQSVTWTFTPENDDYQPVTGSVSITVERAVPQVGKVPVPGAYVYHPTDTLASDKAKSLLNAGAKEQGVVTDAQGQTVAGSWSWKEQSEVPNAGTHTYMAVFTPTDGANYETVEKSVTLAVEKAYVSIKDKISSLSLPGYRHGEYLYNHELTTGSAYYAGKGETDADVDKNVTPVLGKYVWAAPQTRVNYADGSAWTTGYQARYELEFIPDDTENYAGTMETKNNWTNQKMAWVSLSKADNPPYRPGAQMIVAHTCQKVSDVKLPQDWKWSGTDGDIALTENQPVSVYAEYTGWDAECYFNNFYSITITRSSCDHAQTEVRNAKAATCSSEGSTGETWCMVCGEKLDDGTVLVKDSTNHTHLVSKVVKDATTTQEGIMSYSCADCGYYAEKAIAKLPSGGGSTSGGGGSGNSGSGSSGSGGSNSGSGSSGSGGSSSGSGSSSSGGSNFGFNNSENTVGNNTKNINTGVAEIVTPPVPPITTPGQGQTPQTSEQTPATVPSATKQEPLRTGNTSTENAGELAKPFLRNADGKEGWEVITDEAKNAAEGEILVVDMNGASVVPADVFEEIQGKDITIEFDLGNGITWKVNGLSVQAGKAGDIDFSVKLGDDAADTIPVEVINQVTGERMSLNLSLAYEGTFGFEAVLTVKLGEDSAGLFANLFYYNETTGKLEFMCAGEIREDGSVDLNFSHASEYTIVIDDKSMEQEMAEAALGDDGISLNTGDGTDQTGAAGGNTALEEKDTIPDIAWILLLAAAVAVISVGVVVLACRRKSREE